MTTSGFQLEELFDPSLNYPTVGTWYPETQPVFSGLATWLTSLAERLPDGMYLILDIRHSASSLYEIFDD
jgi:hypothetical protein